MRTEIKHFASYSSTTAKWANLVCSNYVVWTFADVTDSSDNINEMKAWSRLTYQVYTKTTVQNQLGEKKKVLNLSTI